jgi:hypothetical protein
LGSRSLRLRKWNSASDGASMIAVIVISYGKLA